MQHNISNKLKSKKKSKKSDDVMASIELDSSIDVESGTITIDDTPPEEMLSTSEVLRESEEGEGGSISHSVEDVVYVLDLKPFFKVIDAEKGSKGAFKLVSLTENLLARTIGRHGTYTCQDNEMFFFRLDSKDIDGWKKASEIVNELGNHFLRGGFKPE